MKEWHTLLFILPEGVLEAALGFRDAVLPMHSC